MLVPQPRHRPRRLLIAAVIVVALVSGTAAAAPKNDAGEVTTWARQNADPVATADPAAPLDDLAPLRRSIGDASIVGLGESTHGATDELTLKHRTVRLLVEQLGFRSIAWEEDWTTGVEINDYISSGGDLAELMSSMSPQYQSNEVADVLRWLRAFNAGRSDKVRFVGVEYYFTRTPAYDAVESYVAATAPDRLAELRENLVPVRPTSSDPFAHIEWYTNVEDKQPYIDHARAVYELLDSLPRTARDRAHSLALHNARQIVSFYEHYSLPLTENVVYRDARAAENLRWWRQYTGDRIVYWAASAHTANAPELRIAQPPGPDLRFPSAGSYLRQWYGDGYLSIGFTLDHGTVSLGAGETIVLPPPSADWFEHPLGEVDYDQFSLDLRQPGPAPVRRWLQDPTRTRGLPDAGPASYIDGGSLAQWFDVIVHRQEVTPATPTGAAS